jgi:sigma-B regulation protein RsbU (phosphoserine phosphatase)
MEPPVAFQYQRLLDELRRGEGDPRSLGKRMSELISLLDLTSTLSSALSRAEILDAALLIVMGEMQASRGALFVTEGGTVFRLKASRGLPAGVPTQVALRAIPEDVVEAAASPDLRAFEPYGLQLLCPIRKAGRPLAVLGLGPRAERRPYGREEAAFLRCVAGCAATPIENGLIYEELKAVNRKLSTKVFQLRNLFEISRELTASFDEETIKSLVTGTLMGHLMVSRCALYLAGPHGLTLAYERGGRAGEEAADAGAPLPAASLPGAGAAAAVCELPPGPLRERLEKTRMALVVPLSLGGRAAEGFIAVGERASGAPFSEEDRDFAFTLGRQALAALESVRLQRVRAEKQRQDQELQIAREIQQSLFPRDRPRIPGFEVAAESHSCYQVGGDYYDYIPLPGGRLAVAIADVSGKGTPASILMASVHASLQALAGTAGPQALMERLNRFLFESTQPNRFVTLFYAELDPAARRLVYVNAGHVPPYRLARDGGAERLTLGGPALGLLDGTPYEAGEAPLEAGELVAMVTDGVTEAMSPDETEFGEERTLETLRRSGRRTAADTVRSLVAAVDSWRGAAGRSDDLTALVLKAS